MCLGATAILLCAGFHPQQSRAEGFTGEEFATWSEASQDSFIQTSLTMAGIIGTQVKPAISHCIDGWYFADDAAKSRLNQSIRGTIIQYADYHPNSVILAVIQEECGEFNAP